MTRSRSVYLCYLICALLSCDFEPDGELFTTVDRASLDGLTIDLANYPEQEIQLKSETMFLYSIETQNKQLLETRVLLDDAIIWISSQPGGSFHLDPAEMETGSYKLRIEFAVTAGTGSLADKLGAEIIYVWTERTILVDNDIPESPDDPNAIAITKVENADYSIKISWEAYTRFNFEKYEVIRRDYDENGNPAGGRIIPVQSSDPNYTNVFDHEYLGGKSEYSIKLYAAGKTYTSPPFEYEHPYKPGLNYEIKADGNVTITWRSLSALKNNFLECRLEVRDFSGGLTQTVAFEFPTVSDTSVTFMPENFKFGRTKQLRLIIYSSFYQNYYSKVHLSQMKHGDSFPFFFAYSFPLHFNVNTRKYYYLTKYGRLQVADANGQPLDSLSEIYNTLKINNSIGIGTSNGKRYRINLETMESEGEITLPDGTLHGLSNDNKVLIGNSEGGKVVTLEGEELFSIEPSIFPGYKGISPGGEYVLSSPWIYRFNGTVFEQWGSWNPFDVLSVSFSLSEPSKVIFGEEEKIRKYNIETKASELTTTAYLGPCNLDPVTNKLGCLNGDQFVILNAEDLQLHRALPVSENAGDFFLLNGKVICSAGMQIDLSDIP
jgi:hypothetical protein